MRSNRIYLFITVICLVVIVGLNRRSLKTRMSKSNGATVDLSDLLAVSVQTVLNVGEDLKQMAVTLDNKQLKSAHNGIEETPVTSLDYFSHCAIKSSLAKWFPSVKVVSEEVVDCDRLDDKGFTSSYNTYPGKGRSRITGFEELQEAGEELNVEDITLWVDPLDATQELTEGLTQYVSLMIGIAYHGEPVAGVLYLPFSELLFWSNVNKMSSVRILSDSGDMVGVELPPYQQLQGNTQIVMSRSHSTNHITEEVLASIVGGPVKVINYGGSGYKASRILRGEEDVYLHLSPIMKWDVCALFSIARNSDFSMTDLHGTEINFSAPIYSVSNVHMSGIILARPELARRLITSDVLKTYLSRPI